MNEVDEGQIASFRVARHHLDQRAARKNLPLVLKRIVAVQSQVSSAAVKSLAARVECLETAHVDDALHERKHLARTWAMRCTLHVVLREDVGLLSAALGVRVGGFKRWLERCGMTEARYEEIREDVVRELERGPLSRSELERALAHKLHGTAHIFGSWGGIMKLLALEGRVVLGPRRSNETTFVRADRWFGAEVVLPDRDAALAALLRRYLAAYGPASVPDFAYWSGVPAGRARAALAAIEGETATVLVKGRPLHVLAADVRALERARPSPGVRLLPHFDTFLLGHRDKSLLFDEKHKKKVFRAAGWVSAVVLERGRVIGTWESRRQGSRREIAVAPFARLSRSTWSALRDEASLVEPGARVLRA